MRNKVPHDAAVSFFAFMDIVTTVSGIMILVVLLFAMKLAEKADEAPAPAAGPPDPTAQIRALAAERTNLQGRLRQALIGKATRTVESHLTNVVFTSVSLSNTLVAVTATNRVLGGEIDDLRTYVADLKAEVDKKRATESLIIIKGEAKKEPVLVVCSGDRIRCGPIGSEKSPREFSARPPDEALTYIERQLDPARQSLLLMLKPSAQGYAGALIAYFKAKNYDLGWDALEEDKILKRE